MPTAFGTAFGFMALVLFFMAAGYANNLIFIFFFMLISIVLTGMLLTNRNVHAVGLVSWRAEPLFAEEQGRVLFQFSNSKEFSCWELEAHFLKNQERSSRLSLPGLSQIEISVPFFSLQRGLVDLPRVVLQSHFPFDLFRAWRNFKVKSGSILVYPARKGSPQFPQTLAEEIYLSQTGLFRDHRLYQAGDSVRRIDWKASARRRDVLIKNFEETEKPTLKFTWSQTSHLEGFEERVSQLCLWIDEAERQGFAYSLKLDSREVPPGKGGEHWHNCLEILALLKEVRV